MISSKNQKKILDTLLWALLIIVSFSMFQCASGKKIAEETLADTLQTNREAAGTDITFRFQKGEQHNHPLMVIWIEDTDGDYIETLYVAESIGTGIFRHGQADKGKWKPGPIRRPAALPYWGHKRGVKAKDGLYIPEPDDPMPDAVTGATPQGSFVLETRTSLKMTEPFVILMEINQSWDWNKYWTNNKYPDDDQYKTSSQPSVIYSAVVTPENGSQTYELEPAGHGHYSGKDGNLYEDLSTLTTALEIADKVEVTIESP